MRIKVIFTGGTIGSAAGAGGVIATAGPAAGRLLLANFFKNAPAALQNGTTFDTAEPYTALSEDLTVEHWNTLLAFLKGIDFKEYNGIIITHGTDTLAYTANLLAMALAGVHIPVLILGSNYVLSDEGADGNLNFEAAVNHIKNGGGAGVFAISNGVFHLGSRVLQCRPFTDDFASVNAAPYGAYANGSFTKNPNGENPTEDQLAAICGRTPLLYNLPNLKANVQVIVPHVGLQYGGSPPDRDIKAVLHGLYHSSTACVGNVASPTASSILTLVKRCSERGTALFIAPFKAGMLAAGARYETTDILMKEGVRFCCDMSFENAYVKLLLAAALYETPDDMEVFINTPLFFEQV